MLTTDLSLRFDPVYEKISRLFMEQPNQFGDAFRRPLEYTNRTVGTTVVRSLPFSDQGRHIGDYGKLQAVQPSPSSSHTNPTDS